MSNFRLVASVTSMLLSEVHLAPAAAEACLFTFARSPMARAFVAHHVPLRRGPLRPPKVQSGEARTYRSAIRAGSQSGVNFAGHYTIVGWGCGSSCLRWAVVDRRTGAVHFDPDYGLVSTVHVDEEGPSSDRLDRRFNALRFKPDSTVLLVQGAPAEDEAREGVTFLEWSGREFRKLAFVPAAKLCR